MAAVLVAVASSSSVKAQPSATAAVETNDPAAIWKAEYGPSHEERMQWWREARFGMFIHWGVYFKVASRAPTRASK